MCNAGIIPVMEIPVQIFSESFDGILLYTLLIDMKDDRVPTGNAFTPPSGDTDVHGNAAKCGFASQCHLIFKKVYLR
ncbi:MAG: hypothetical protein AMDU1_APLC00007G0039 [Thermoplasmatales archaeon A-plasma]|jgi:hypothetical protein|nr:MAG: hypothetical protein AMDU1_APLC00007G0039 [Thermoplasmatales archaeon A-plasma]